MSDNLEGEKTRPLPHSPETPPGSYQPFNNTSYPPFDDTTVPYDYNRTPYSPYSAPQVPETPVGPYQPNNADTVPYGYNRTPYPPYAMPAPQGTYTPQPPPQYYQPAKRPSPAKRIGTILLIVLLLSGGIAGVLYYLLRSTPEKTLSDFCSGLQQANYHNSYQQLSLVMQHAFSERDFTATLTHDQVATCTYASINATDTSAQTTLTLHHTSNKNNADQVTLTKDAQQHWKIATIQPAQATTIPKQAETHHLTLAAQQQLRDPASVFSMKTRGANTGIALVRGERVIIFLSGTITSPTQGSSMGPTGGTSCSGGTFPEAKLHCYAAIYSLGLTQQAQEAGNRADFVVPADTTLFLGVNIPEQLSASGTFQVTVYTVPSGTATGRWQSPTNNFFTQQHVSLSAEIFAQNVPGIQVTFSLKNSTGITSTICHANYAQATGIASCDWDLTTLASDGTNVPVDNGSITLGFSLQAPGAALDNPDGVRSGLVRYVTTEQSYNYAGYGAQSRNTPAHYQNVTMQWTVPPVTCTAGENSDVGIWSGMTGSADTSQLAQTGTLGGCVDGQAAYAAWWEMYPKPSHFISYPLNAGDVVSAQVTYHQGTFQLLLINKTRGWQFSTNQSGLDTDTTNGLCIVEAPFDTQKNQIERLSNFGTLTASCQVNSQPIGITGPQNVLYQLNGPQQQATTSPLDQKGSSFTIQWKQP